MRSRYKQGTGIGVISIVVLLICGVVAYKGIELKKENASLNNKNNQTQTQIEDEKIRSEEIKNLEADVESKKYIENIAREKLGLVYKDEIILKPSK